MSYKFSDLNQTQESSKSGSSTKCSIQTLPHNIPERYKNITSCWISAGYSSSEHFAPDHEYVLCTKTSEIIEINKDGIPVLSCQINFPAVLITRSYIKHNELLKIFYVVRSKENKLAVIERKDNALEVIVERNDVDKFDFISGQCPCLKIWYKTTDAIDTIPLYQQNQNEISSNRTEIESENIELMQRLDSEIAQYCCVLEEKERSLEAKRNLNEKILSKLIEDFSYGPYAPIMENGQKSNPLIVKCSWKRVFNGKLIIGVEVENVSIRYDKEEELQNVETFHES